MLRLFVSTMHSLKDGLYISRARTYGIEGSKYPIERKRLG